MSTPAKRTPDGFVAQRFDGRDPKWVELSLRALVVQVRQFTDEEAADWPDLEEATAGVVVELKRLQAVEHAARSYLTAKGVDMIGWGRELCDRVGVDDDAQPPCAGCASPLCPDCTR